ncbi:synaptopodin [Pelodytes ibericus]
MEVSMMPNSSLSSQTSLGHPMLRGLSCSFMESEKKAKIAPEPWITSFDMQKESSLLKEEEGKAIGNPQDHQCEQDADIVKAHWTLVEEEPTHGGVDLTSDDKIPNGEGERSVETVKKPVQSGPLSEKMEDDDHVFDLEQVSNSRVASSFYQSQKSSYLLRSFSLTEKELKEAQSIGDNNAAQLSPTQGSCSRGVLLFHRRRQRINTLEQQKLTKSTQGPGPQQANSPEKTQTPQHGLKLLRTKKTEYQFGSEPSVSVTSMEETSSDAGYEGETENKWGLDQKGSEFPPIDKRAPSPGASEEDLQAPLSAHLKETLVLSTSNGLITSTDQESEPTNNNEQKVTQNGTQNKQYCEVHITLSKPKSVANRTARPFGNQASAKKMTSSSEKSPVIELPPPPTYAETLSSPPPVTRIISPPAYSALYPTDSQHIKPVTPVTCHGEARLTPQPKSGILEEMGARRGPRKSMFTFVEKPKMTPNPDLLSMVQTADDRRKSKDQVDIPTEEESFALGAEASNFQSNKTIRSADNAGANDKASDWTSCLKSPGVKAKPPPVPVQTLTEAKGKGAELFARRQSRMERFVVESPSHYDSVRSPSPTMSLPPSWTYASNAQSSPTHLGRQVRINQRSPKPFSAPPPTNTVSESVQSQKELEISKRQPYQLQSSLFILSPTKDPLSSLPKGAPPPKPMVMQSPRYTRQSSCPTSPVIPSPTMYSPSYFNSLRSPSATLSPSPTGFGRRTPTSQVSPVSPVPFSNAGVAPSRTRTGIQAPRPSFSAKNAGLESQRSRDNVSASPTQRALQHRGSLDGWGNSSLSFRPVSEEGSGIQSPPPFRSMSPAWSDRSPSPFKVENDLKSGNQMKALIARNIINAAKRKSTSPWGLTSPQSPMSPTPSGGIWSPTNSNGNPLLETSRARRSPTGSDISMESEDSGAKSPGFRSYPFSPRGWYGSMRHKRDSLPTSQSFTYTP